MSSTVRRRRGTLGAPDFNALGQPYTRYGAPTWQAGGRAGRAGGGYNYGLFIWNPQQNQWDGDRARLAEAHRCAGNTPASFIRVGTAAVARKFLSAMYDNGCTNGQPVAFSEGNRLAEVYGYRGQRRWVAAGAVSGRSPLPPPPPPAPPPPPPPPPTPPRSTPDLPGRQRQLQAWQLWYRDSSGRWQKYGSPQTMSAAQVRANIEAALRQNANLSLGYAVAGHPDPQWIALRPPVGGVGFTWYAVPAAPLQEQPPPPAPPRPPR